MHRPTSTLIQRLRRAGAVGLFALLGSGACLAATPSPLAFDIPTQPLDQALAQYSHVTGLTVLVDGALVVGRRSAAVIGVFTAHDALQRLLQGQPLALRYASARSFTLVARHDVRQEASQSNPTGIALTGTHYGARVQQALKQAVCRVRDLLPGGYRALVQLWVGPQGGIDRVSLVESTGSAQVDARLTATLVRAEPGVLPAGMPQPITVLLRGQREDGRDECAVAEAARG
ncbi:Outer membrane TonB-dependent transducer VreA of trans-envelope signaling system [plant metagenome]|uniref:Outer membrane TonB-dependent transducer VreA of trans-envelope signaling system n=1 Tax=plant metagenome TaxID=1297885 RepID=A0A484PHI7_9ZZZZ